MTVGKKRLVHVLVNIDTFTNLDNSELERRFESFIDLDRFRSESLEPREVMRFISTVIKLYDMTPDESVTPLTIVEPASDGLKLQVIRSLVKSIHGTYKHPDDLERVVLDAFGKIAQIVKEENGLEEAGTKGL